MNTLTNLLLRAVRLDDATEMLVSRIALGSQRYCLYESPVLYQAGRAVRWADRLHMALVATDLGRADIAIEQLDAIRLGSRPTERASQAAPAGCVARLNSFPGVAAGHFAAATELFTSLHISEAVADVLGARTPCVAGVGGADTFRGVASGVRSGPSL